MVDQFPPELTRRWITWCTTLEIQFFRRCTDSFIQAFPLSLKDVEEKFYEKPEETLHRVYILRSLERFADFFGLVELKSVSGTPYKPEYQVRATGLLDAVLQFGTGRPGSWSGLSASVVNF